MGTNNAGQAGQASVEYALVLMAFMATIAALCVLWQAASGGELSRLAREHASHNCDGGISAGLMQDILAY